MFTAAKGYAIVTGEMNALQSSMWDGVAASLVGAAVGFVLALVTEPFKYWLVTKKIRKALYYEMLKNYAFIDLQRRGGSAAVEEDKVLDFVAKVITTVNYDNAKGRIEFFQDLKEAWDIDATYHLIEIIKDTENAAAVQANLTGFVRSFETMIANNHLDRQLVLELCRASTRKRLDALMVGREKPI